MDKKQVFQGLGAAALLFLSATLLYWSLTRTEEIPLILSKASLKGKVTFKGKAVPHALVIVSGDDSSSVGMADAQGNYFVEYAPAGSVKIGVNTAAGRGMMTGALMSAAVSGDKKAAPEFVDLPEKFFAPQTSGITAQLANQEGLNEFDIDIN